jgi:hypothetical protein
MATSVKFIYLFHTHKNISTHGVCASLFFAVEKFYQISISVVTPSKIETSYKSTLIRFRGLNMQMQTKPATSID